jgi:hypothetical protein
MLSKLKLQTLKQKLWAIIAASFTARVIMFFALPNTPSFLAPDEGTYAFLAKWISESKPATDFPTFGGDLYLSGRSLIIPASTLVKFGMNELDAVRLVSSIYGLLALCVVAYFANKLNQPGVSRSVRNKRIESLVLVLIFVYAFLPSHFVWSNLGLRESSNEFWLLITFLGVFLFYRDKQPRKFLISLLIFTSIVCTFSSRPQVGWVLAVSILLYFLFNLRNKLTYILIAFVSMGLFTGYLATTSFTDVTSDLFVAKELIPTRGNFGVAEVSKLCNREKEKVEFKGKTYICIKSGTVTKREGKFNLARAVIDEVALIPEKQIGNQVGAASMIERIACPWKESSEIGKYGCLAFRAPYMTLTFLFRPLPFIDTTSFSSAFAAAENTLWILMFVLIVYGIFRVKKIPFFGELAPCLIFFSLYVVGAGAYEGNMGTAFRHKSLILWIVLLLLFAVFWREQDEAKEPQGNNSQESAL